MPRILAVALLGLVACSQGTAIDPSADDAQAGRLSGCHGHASSTIPASGVYGLTTFGGPSEPQPLACGGNSSSGSWYYAASSQRYPCGTRLRVEANGRCVIAQVADYGPDVCVESAAGHPILDASPLVGHALFGESDLGWSDGVTVHVTLAPSGTPLGICAASSASSSSASSSVSTSASTSASTGGGAGGSGPACSSDGDCNPGDEGSGRICVRHACVAGCNADWQCPGVETCRSGMCRTGSSGSGGAGGAPATTTSTTASSTTGGGMPCAGDGDCNPGNDGSGMICTSHQCVDGCHSDAQCPGVTTCEGGFCQ